MLLRQAGWSPERNGLADLALPPEFEIFDEAARALKQYGGLTFNHRGYETLVICPCDCVELDRDTNIIAEFSKQSGQRVYPIGVLDGGDTVGVVINYSGWTYITLVDEVRPVSASFEDFIVGSLVTTQDERVAIHQRMQDAKMTPWIRRKSSE